MATMFEDDPVIYFYQLRLLCVLYQSFVHRGKK